MPSHDDADLLYAWYPLPDGEACHFWLRTAWELIEGGMRVPQSIIDQIEHWGVDASEFIKWVEFVQEDLHGQPVSYRSIN